MNLAEILRRRAEEFPERPALIERRGRHRRVLTFRELDVAAARAACELHRAGLKPGDSILILHRMSIELYVLLTGILRGGCLAMFADPGAGIAHLDRCCAVLPPKGFFGSVSAQWLRFLLPGLRTIPHKFCMDGFFPGTTSWKSEGPTTAGQLIVAVNASTPALITLTSGTGGEPKAAVRTHGFLVAQHHALEESLCLREGGVDLATLPIFVLANLASGVTTILPDTDLRRPGHARCQGVWEQICVESPTRVTANPAFLTRLMGTPGSENRYGRGFTKIFTGGSPVFPTFLDRLQRWAPQAKIVAVYGSSEAEPISRLAWEDVSAADRTVMAQGGGLLAGSPVTTIKVRILSDCWGEPIAAMTDARFHQVCCSTGTAGEIVVSGNHVLPGYLHGRGDAETKFRVDDTIWHRTGDAGFVDERGRLWLLGRCSGRVREGEKGAAPYPLTVETAAHHHAVLRHAAFVLKDGKRALLVEADGTVNLAQLAERLAWARLDDIRQVKRLPVDPRHNGKILYQRIGVRESTP